MNTLNFRTRIWKLMASCFLVAVIATGCAGAAPTTPTVDPAELPAVRKNQGVSAEAQVVPATSAVLSFTISGVVEEILIAEGSIAQKGDVIARLSGKERLEANMAAAELGVVQSNQNLKNLDETAALIRSNTELELAQAEILLKDILEDREKLDYQRASQNTLDELRGNYLLAQQAVEDAEETYSFVQDRDEDDLERAQALIYLSRVRKTRDRALENLNYALGKPDPEDIAEADAKVQVARERVEDAKRKLNNLKDGPDLDNLQLAKAQLKNSELQLASAKAALDDIELRAPFTGVVATTNLKVGQFIGPGQPAVEIGDLTKWVVETTDLTELDVVGIAPGNRVEVEFDAIPDLLLGGEVTQVKPRGQNTRGDITYVVVINLDEQDERLLWAMSAVVRFIQN